LLKSSVDASAVRKAVSSAALTKARGLPDGSSSVSVPCGDVLDVALLPLDGARDAGHEPDVWDSGADDDPESWVSEELEVFDGGVDSDSDEIEDTVDSSFKIELVSESNSVTTLMPSPSLLEPGMKRVVDPSLRVIDIREGWQFDEQLLPGSSSPEE
jgi:hypothetical protein